MGKFRKNDCLCHKFGENHANWTIIRSLEVSFQICLPCPIVAQIGSNRSFDERIVGNTFPAAVRHSVQTAMSEASGHRTFAKPTPSMCNTVCRQLNHSRILESYYGSMNSL